MFTKNCEMKNQLYHKIREVSKWSFMSTYRKIGETILMVFVYKMYTLHCSIRLVSVFFSAATIALNCEKIILKYCIQSLRFQFSRDLNFRFRIKSNLCGKFAFGALKITECNSVIIIKNHSE